MSSNSNSILRVTIVYRNHVLKYENMSGPSYCLCAWRGQRSARRTQWSVSAAAATHSHVPTGYSL